MNDFSVKNILLKLAGFALNILLILFSIMLALTGYSETGLLIANNYWFLAFLCFFTGLSTVVFLIKENIRYCVIGMLIGVAVGLMFYILILIPQSIFVFMSEFFTPQFQFFGG